MYTLVFLSLVALLNAQIQLSATVINFHSTSNCLGKPLAVAVLDNMEIPPGRCQALDIDKLYYVTAWCGGAGLVLGLCEDSACTSCSYPQLPPPGECGASPFGFAATLLYYCGTGLISSSVCDFCEMNRQ